MKKTKELQRQKKLWNKENKLQSKLKVTTINIKYSKTNNLYWTVGRIWFFFLITLIYVFKSSIF